MIVLLLFTAASFLVYGFTCLFSPKMKLEFIRFGLNQKQRIITGIAQILGSLGLLLGLFLGDLLVFLAALGLAILMAAGFAVRIKIRDPFQDAAPSFIFLILNAWIAYAYMP